MKCTTTDVEKCECPCCVHLKEAFFFHRLVRNINARDCAVVHDQILVPFLKSFNALIPSLFPLDWVDNPPPPLLHLLRTTTILVAVDSLRGEYYEMCVLVSDWRKQFSKCSSSSSSSSSSRTNNNCDELLLLSTITHHRRLDLVAVAVSDASGLLCSLKCKGESLLNWLAARRRWLVEKRVDLVSAKNSVLVFRMRMQAKLINGIDIVYSRVYAEAVAVSGSTRSPLSTGAMCQFARDVGAVDRMRELAIAFKQKFTASSSFRVARYMSELVTSLDDLREDEERRLVAVAMSLHLRLGGRSQLACIGGDVLPLCVHRTICTPLLGLRDVFVVGKSSVRLVD